MHHAIQYLFIALCFCSSSASFSFKLIIIINIYHFDETRAALATPTQNVLDYVNKKSTPFRIIQLGRVPHSVALDDRPHALRVLHHQPALRRHTKHAHARPIAARRRHQHLVLQAERAGARLRRLLQLLRRRRRTDGTRSLPHSRGLSGAGGCPPWVLGRRLRGERPLRALRDWPHMLHGGLHIRWHRRLYWSLRRLHGLHRLHGLWRRASSGPPGRRRRSGLWLWGRRGAERRKGFLVVLDDTRRRSPRKEVVVVHGRRIKAGDVRVPPAVGIALLERAGIRVAKASGRQRYGNGDRVVSERVKGGRRGGDARCARVFLNTREADGQTATPVRTRTAWFSGSKAGCLLLKC